MDALLGKVWESGKRIRRGMMTISSGSKSNWVIEHVFTGSSRQRLDNGDEEALKWAALQKLPTYDRSRTTLMRLSPDDQNIDKLIHKEVDVRKLALMERQAFIQRLLKVAEEDNERLLLDVRRRIDRVGITLAQVEVRFEHFTIDAECHAGSQALPTLWNSFRNSVDSLLGMIGLPRNNKTVLTILEDANGILKASRMILLLGPLQSGKTTLLRALAGKLDADLKVKGQITYNGHGLDEFVPLKTSAYISQHDVLAPDMTVRETLDFSARCQGVGSKRDMLSELLRREKEAGIFPDPEVDLFMKATYIGGVQSSLQTDYILKLKGR